MKRIFLIRHAKSSWDKPHLPDDRRPLNVRGKRDAPMMAEIMLNRYKNLDIIYSSPAKRAYTTAKNFAKAFDIDKKNIIKSKNLYFNGTQSVIEVLRSISDPIINSVAIFGHNPDWTHIVNTVPNADIDNVPTCGIAVIESDCIEWSQFSFNTSVLKDFLYPKRFNLK